MDNDLNTANVITLLENIVKKMNSLLRTKEINTLGIEYNTFKTILDVLGVNVSYKKLSLVEKDLYKEWEKYKSEKNFEEADKIRQKLTELGVL